MIKKWFYQKWIYLGFIFLFMLFFNFLTPYIMDDYQLLYDFYGNERNQSIFDVFLSLKEMYFHWGGRVLAHFFAYSFLRFPKWIFNIVNSFIYVWVVDLIFELTKGKNNVHYSYLWLIHMVLFIFFPCFAQVFLWLDGSCNYSFTLCIQLYFIYKILHISKKNSLSIFLYFLLGIFSGMCNENSSLSLIVFLFMFMILNHQYLSIKISSMIGLVCGYLFLFLAPGNYVRMAERGATSFFTNIVSKFLYLIESFWPIILAFSLFVFIFYKKHSEEGKMGIIYYIACLIAFFSMLASPQLNVRSFTMPTIYLIIISFSWFFFMKNLYLKSMVWIMCSGLFLFYFILTTMEYVDYSVFQQNRIHEIQQAAELGKESVTVSIYPTSSNCRVLVSCDLEDILEDSEDMPNYFIGKYYGISVFGKK